MDQTELFISGGPLERVNFHATGLESIFQNVRTILATIAGTVPLDRHFGLSQNMVDDSFRIPVDPHVGPAKQAAETVLETAFLIGHEVANTLAAIVKREVASDDMSRPSRSVWLFGISEGFESGSFPFVNPNVPNFLAFGRIGCIADFSV